MKKWVIGSLVGAIIVFGWQALSHTVLGIHNNDLKYTSSQTAILSNLSSSLKEDGAYLLPSGATPDEQRKVMEGNAGKPWASIIYHSAMVDDMTMSMIRGFLVCIVLVVILIYLLTRGGTPTSIRIICGSVALGLAFFLYGPYTGRIWYQFPWHMIKGDLIDALVAWTLCGLWLSFWLPRTPVRPSERA
jgi:hypothetical protein